MSSPILRLRKVVKRFGGLVAVNKVDLDVNRGEILGLIGPNGSGKTTLFNIIMNIKPADEGDVFFKGVRINNLPPHRVARMGIGRTFQVVRPFPDLTVFDNVLVGSLFGKTFASGREEARDWVEEVLRMVGLWDKRHVRARSLNLPLKKRLEVARALAGKPDLLLLDEVMAGLTPGEMDEVLGLVRRIRDDLGVTIILVEHVMRAVMGVSDRVVVLNHGVKIAEGTPEEVANNPEVIEVYLGHGGG